jgi:hypothetical protein
MLKGRVLSAISAILLLSFPVIVGAQAPAAAAPANPNGPAAVDGWTHRPVPPLSRAQAEAPAPQRDIFGVWDPGNGGIQPMGAGANPEDGMPEHELPYTPLGRERLALTKPSNGVRSVLPAETNDPVVACDPQGFPREDLYELRTTQIIQRSSSVAFLFEFGKVWRVAWTDGRQVPANPEPRWFGYSVGKWEDDYTFVVQTTGISERTWIDRAGRPHSEDLRVEERYHRVNYGTMELTVIINDPQMYTKPWVALNKLRFRLQPESFDVTEMMCSPSQISEYNKRFGYPASNMDQDGK